MPILSNLQQHNIPGSHYGFSGAKLQTLTATEYTLVTICTDVSGSVSSFKTEIESCLQNIIQSCAAAPRADNLLLRLTTFNTKIRELHGFRPLAESPRDAYQNILRTSGCTALYDATHNAIEAIQRYGKQLSTNAFAVNGILFVITDGADNASTTTPKTIKDALSKSIQDEHLDNMLAVLIGINVHDNRLSKQLTSFSSQAGFDSYIELQDASANALEKLAFFVSKSISLQSRALGSGKTPVPLTF